MTDYESQASRVKIADPEDAALYKSQPVFTQALCPLIKGIMQAAQF